MSGRKEVYPEYKAQRTTRPDLLREQWPHLRAARRGVRLPQLRVDGYEADDVIASLAERAREQGIPVTIVTGDRDAFQLVDPSARARHGHLARHHRHEDLRLRRRWSSATASRPS